MKYLARYKELEEIIAILGIEELSEEDKRFVIERVDKLNRVGLVELYNALGEYMEW